jgi:hypothetical protein
VARHDRPKPSSSFFLEPLRAIAETARNSAIAWLVAATTDSRFVDDLHEKPSPH